MKLMISGILVAVTLLRIIWSSLFVKTTTCMDLVCEEYNKVHHGNRRRCKNPQCQSGMLVHRRRFSLLRLLILITLIGLLVAVILSGNLFHYIQTAETWAANAYQNAVVWGGNALQSARDLLDPPITTVFDAQSSELILDDAAYAKVVQAVQNQKDCTLHLRYIDGQGSPICAVEATFLQGTLVFGKVQYSETVCYTGGLQLLDSRGITYRGYGVLKIGLVEKSGVWQSRHQARKEIVSDSDDAMDMIYYACQINNASFDQIYTAVRRYSVTAGEEWKTVAQLSEIIRSNGFGE